VLVATVALVLSACTGGSDDEGAGDDTPTGPTGRVPRGGTLVVGAEEEPDCADWLSSCASLGWGLYTMQEHTMPRVFDFAKRDGVWTEVPSILLTGEPVMTTPTPERGQTVTYMINPDAVWSDGEPITSTDFKYTWNEIVSGPDVYDPTGYNLIESIDDSNPKTAVVTFSRPYAAWKSLFGAFYGVLPSHLLSGQDRRIAMTNGYSWSGGPWIATWTKGENVELTPNPNWYGEKPKLDRVVFEFQASRDAEFAAFRRGELHAIYPEPELDTVRAIRRGIPNANASYTADTGNIEALWINNEREPFNSRAVRQAFAYAIDRDAIVQRLFGALDVTEAVNTINPPIQYRYSEPEAWARYDRDIKQVNRLMSGDGWTRNGDGIWEKGGRPAFFRITSTTGDPRRALTERIVRNQLRSAGFAVQVVNQSDDQLFLTTLPSGDYEVALYAQIATSMQPGLCSIFCTVNIPSPANNGLGQNYGRVSTAADGPLTEVAMNLDETARQEAAKQADVILAEEQVALPLDPLPNIMLWSKRIVGPVHDDPLLGMFANVHQWGLRKPARAS
jgi:peptide/nickel transport system substrate-binding protein